MIRHPALLALPFLAAALLATSTAGGAHASPLDDRIDAAARAIEPRTLAWRRDIHRHPELGDAEVRTSALVADHLRRLGIEVRTGVAKTGLVAVLRGGKPGPVVALRAEMDALPVREPDGLPFASKATGTYEGKTVPVMHACGHDAHVAILMSVAEILAGMKADLPGTVVFYFQPAEEGPADFRPDGKRFWGARQMIAEGAMDAPKPDAVFGLHVVSGRRTGEIAWRPGPELASADELHIVVHGRQTHGAQPWGGVDPIVVGAQIVMGLQTIESRQMQVTKEPSIVTIGQFHGGLRNNIIPDTVEMAGTIRAYDDGMQRDLHARITRTATLIAQSAGATADVSIVDMYPTTINDPALTARMAPTLERVAGPGMWDANADKWTASEDFSFYGRRAPALFLFLGVTPPAKVATAAANHSPNFFVDEAALMVGVRALAELTVDYMQAGKTPG